MAPPDQKVRDVTTPQRELEGIRSQTDKEGFVLPIVADKIHNLKEVYSTALGGHRDWSNDVNLGPPKIRRNDFSVSLFVTTFQFISFQST